jgi:amino acid adenylation domain-containing protein
VEKSDDVVARRSALSPNKRALLEKRLQRNPAGSTRVTISPRTPGCRIPLSFAQQRLWFLHWLEPTNPAYNEAGALHIQGPLNVAIFARAITAVARRHEILRSTFSSIDGEPEQVVHPEPHPEIVSSVVDLTGLPKDERRREAISRMRQEIVRPFDLERGPVTRFTFFQAGPEEFYLVHTMHHIISDSWSLAIFIEEIVTHYTAYLQDRPVTLPELPIQYGDYACWERENANFERQFAYWKAYLDGAPAFLDLPTDQPRRPDRAGRAGRVALSIAPDVIELLRALARQENATLFMLLLAAFAALLYRYSGQSDVLIGTPVAGRTLPELENLIGFLVNTLVLRTRVDGQSSFREFVRVVKGAVLGAVNHDDMPFERLVQGIRPARSLRHTPLFQVMFQFDNFRQSAGKLPALEIEDIDLPSAGAKFDLTLVLYEAPNRLNGYLEYDADLFDESTVVRMAGHLRELIADGARKPERSVGTLALLSSAERQLQLNWNQTDVKFASDQYSIHQLFELQARRTPDAIAVISEKERLTYSALNRRANQIADGLRKLGVAPNQAVGICMQRSAAMIAAIFGTLKAGAAYVPLDPTNPRERISFVLREAGMRTVITQAALLNNVAGGAVQVVCVDDQPDQIDVECEEDPHAVNAIEDLAYVIYTSGSTGIPKGVMVSHKSLVNYTTWAAGEFKVGPQDRILQFASIAFDASIEEIFLALTAGATLVLRNEEILYSAKEFLRYCKQWQITILDLPTAYWHELVASFGPDLDFPETIRLVVIGGERVIGRALIAWKNRVAPRVRLINTYGPTEATIVCTYCDLVSEQVSPDLRGDVSIGRPIHNVRVRILDDQLQLIPVGATGELHIAGAGLALGYLNDPAMTAQKFISDPYALGMLMYKSGDRGRYRTDGSIEFVGRLDEQEKIRGFRVELGEIEATVRRHPAIRDCVVLTKQNAQGDKDATAYVLTAGENICDATELSSFLKDKLPDYMLPRHVVFLDCYPLTSSGKVDREALSAIEPKGTEQSPLFVAPRTGAEEIMSLIWAQVLGREQIGIHEDFFAAGGHSLLAIRLVSRIREVFERDVTVRQLFEAPSVSGITAAINQAARVSSDSQAALSLRHASRDIPIPLTVAQEDFWRFDHEMPSTSAPLFNITLETKLIGEFEQNALADALAALIKRHESLRTVFRFENGKPRQVVLQPQQFSLTTYDLRDFSETDRNDAISYLRNEVAKRRFTLAEGPLFDAMLLRVGAEEHIILMVLHHIIGDGWSMDIIARDLEALYRETAHGKPARLPELPVQYADYAIWQRQSLIGDHGETLLNHWLRHLAGPLEPVAFPPDRPFRKEGRSLRYGRHSTTLPKNLTRELRVFGRAENVTSFMLLVSFIKILLHLETGMDDVRIGTTCAGRTSAALENVVGMFANTLVLRTDLAARPTFRELVRRVRRGVLEAFDHQDLPFETLASSWSERNGQNASILYQVAFFYENSPIRLTGIPGLSARPLGERRADDNEMMLSNLPLIIEAVDGLPLTIVFRYDTDFYDRSTIERLLSRLLRLIEQFTTTPDDFVANGQA